MTHDKGKGGKKHVHRWRLFVPWFQNDVMVGCVALKDGGECFAVMNNGRAERILNRDERTRTKGGKK